MEVLINSESKDFNVASFERLIRDAVAIAAKLEDIDYEFEVSVSFVSNQAIRELNRDYRNLDSPTDVLSFPQDSEENFTFPEGFPRMLGDIIISFEKAKEQAEDYGHELSREVIYLTVHGFLHLLGCDHETDEEQSNMRKREKIIMKELGLGRGYNEGESSLR